jgi:hypothetical protein
LDTVWNATRNLVIGSHSSRELKFGPGTGTVTDLIYFSELEPMCVGAVLYLYESGKKSDSAQKTFVQS